MNRNSVQTRRLTKLFAVRKAWTDQARAAATLAREQGTAGRYGVVQTKSPDGRYYSDPEKGKYAGLPPSIDRVEGTKTTTYSMGGPRMVHVVEEPGTDNHRVEESLINRRMQDTHRLNPQGRPEPPRARIQQETYTVAGNEHHGMSRSDTRQFLQERYGISHSWDTKSIPRQEEIGPPAVVEHRDISVSPERYMAGRPGANYR